MKKIAVSSAFLKNIAYTTMFIDHFFAVVFLAYISWSTAQGIWLDDAYGIYTAGRAIGRIAFVLFAFMASEGFCHTHSREKYLLRLGIFALVSEIPFDLAINDTFLETEGQNVYFTLFLGVLALCLIEKFRKRLLLQILGVLLCSALAVFLRTDYMLMGVLLIVVFYLFRRSFLLKFLAGSIVIYFGTVALYVVTYWGYGYPVSVYLDSAILEMCGLSAFILIYLYNGKKGRQLPKACYYLFYPLHLLLLYGMKQWFFV
ncbi:MAG: conjugal transfer protein TraX [Ruminococcus sp.]|nr:conjugal transfer protein TraX [Ruminococcus sp.]